MRKNAFSRRYPETLFNDIRDQRISCVWDGINIHFHYLSLHVSVGERTPPPPIVDNVTGRIKKINDSNYLGSGAGKKLSLLNASYGRGKSAYDNINDTPIGCREGVSILI